MRVNTESGEQKLEQIRQVSNIIQALENLAAQCGEAEAYVHLKNFSLQALGFAQQHLQYLIHQP